MTSKPTSFAFTDSGGGDLAANTNGSFTFDFSSMRSAAPEMGVVETWARNEYRKLYCNTRGKQTIPVDVESLKRDLLKKKPGNATEIDEAIQRLDTNIIADICKQFPCEESGAFKDYAAVIIKLNQMRPDLARKMMVGQVVDNVEKQNMADMRRGKFSPPLKLSSTPTLSQEQPLSSRTRSKLKSTAGSSEGAKNTSSPLDSSTEAGVSLTKQSRQTPMSHAQVDTWVREEYRKRYCDATGTLLRVPPFTAFKIELESMRPGYSDVIATALERLDEELAAKPLTQQQQAGLFALAQLECDRLSWAEHTRQLNRAVVVTALSIKRPDVHRKRLEEVVIRAEEVQKNAARQAMAKAPPTPVAKVAATKLTAPAAKSTKSKFPPGTTAKDFDLSTTHGQEGWVCWHYLEHGFERNGTFKSYRWLKNYLISIKSPIDKGRIRQIVNRLREPGHKYSFPNPEKTSNSIRAAKARAEERGEESTVPNITGWHDKENPRNMFTGSFPNANSTVATNGPCAITSASNPPVPNSFTPPVPSANTPSNDLLARKLNQIRLSDKPTTQRTNTVEDESEESDSDPEDHDSGVDVPSPEQDDDSGNYCTEIQSTGASGRVDHHSMDLLLSDDSDEDEYDQNSSEDDDHLQHAPLFDASMLSDSTQHLVPQYGLIGSHHEVGHAKSRLFLNTNVPFSAFICGVQGSGKSHTTACILENALIPSDKLGQLQNPLSALVFSYGHFSGDGAGYSISEAAFLASPHPKLSGGAHIKKINVLVSPSNFVRISKLYQRIPNVTTTPFKLKPWNLDIDIMLTLMNVNESEDTPLYMAQVTEILRRMATAGGPFNYGVFKQELKKQRFNPAQISMLQMRLNLLESFLDMDNSCPEPQFLPGEITIMDMSCPFTDANTACILFRIGLERYLQSNSPGKMIVLDEAHKYMINVPGAKSLNETLLQTIRLQRHYGARVVISTQEPTLLTDMIALCSITVVHRFTSPEWFAAIKRHIPIAAEDREHLMRRIEGLKTGSAFVYSSNAVLGRDEDGDLVRGTGRMMKVSVRKRITSDGGQSVLAV